MTPLIGKPCVCGHDTLDHYPEGCIRCRHSLPIWEKTWQHRFLIRRVAR